MIMASWHHGIMASWYHGIMVSWYHGIMASYHGFMASWHHGITAGEHPEHATQAYRIYAQGWMHGCDAAIHHTCCHVKHYDTVMLICAHVSCSGGLRSNEEGTDFLAKRSAPGV